MVLLPLSNVLCAFFCILTNDKIKLHVRLKGMDRLYILRDVVSTGPLARGHLIWPPGHLLLDSTGPDWSPTFKA